MDSIPAQEQPPTGPTHNPVPSPPVMPPAQVPGLPDDVVAASPLLSTRLRTAADQIVAQVAESLPLTRHDADALHEIICCIADALDWAATPQTGA